MYTFIGEKSVIFLINSLIIFTILMKKYLNSRINICKKYFLDFYIFIYTRGFHFKCTSKKTISLHFSTFLSGDITRSDVFFWKNHSSLTSIVGHISHQAKHCWKALEEYIPNIYTFMAQNYVNFLINSLIIFTILMKKYLNSLTH